MTEVDPTTSSVRDAELPPARAPINGFGLLLLPIALLVYLIAMPFFALFWVIEWFLPLQSQDPDELDVRQPLPALHRRAEDSPSH